VSEPVHVLILVAAVAVAAPALVDLCGRWVAIPPIVFEIMLGILIGPDVLGWVHEEKFVTLLANFGLAMLFLLAGYEVDFVRVRGRPLNRAVIGWLLSLVLGVGLGLLLAPTAAAGVLAGICLTSTALGTILPVLRDAGEVRTDFGTSVMAVGAAGEFGPLVAIALFLSGRSPAKSAAVLIFYALLIAGLVALLLLRDHVRVHRLIHATLHSSGQMAVRIVVLVLALLIGLATSLGLDMLLGAFAAGVLVKLLLSSGDPDAAHTVETKLDAVGFGFLIPIFFVNTGITFNLDALLSKPATFALVPVVLVLFLVVRGIPASLAAPPGAGLDDKLAIVLFGATGLPIIVAVTTIGLDHGELKSSTAAVLVGAGMLSVLLFPLLGLRRRRRALSAEAAARTAASRRTA
jgi:Kef-type K+ transport system membrane component KefB